MRVTRGQQAETDAFDIALHISEDSMDAAERFLDQGEITVRQLQHFPRSGPHVALVQSPRLRCLAVPGFPKYFLFYELNSGEVGIAQIGDIRRDWSAPPEDEI